MNESPFLGLNPYSSAQASYFFGREDETRVLGANLRSSRLTLLYGPSGVGKTSLLSAGLVARLERTAAQNRQRRGKPGFVPVLLRSWQDDPRDAVADAIRRALSQALPDLHGSIPLQGNDLPVILHAWSQLRLGDLLLILDQFELLFVYHVVTDDHPFIDALARCVADPALSANFLISIREDWLTSLDVFKGRIPGLFRNYLRLRKLDRAAATAAITGPVERFNEEHGTQIEIEPGLIEAVLARSTERPQFEVAGEPGSGIAAVLRRFGRGRQARLRLAPEGAVFDAPALQLIMQRLWNEEHADNSATLRLSTLQRLTHERDIVDQYVGDVMGLLRWDERRLAAVLVDRLVTPSGTKIAQTLTNLAAHVGGRRERTQAVIGKLAPLLNDVAPPRGVQDRCFEISHDVLAPALARWQTGYAQRRKLARSGLLSVVLAGFFLVAAGFGIYAAKQRNVALATQGVLSVTVRELKERKDEIEREKRRRDEIIGELQRERQRFEQKLTEKAQREQTLEELRAEQRRREKAEAELAALSRGLAETKAAPPRKEDPPYFPERRSSAVDLGTLSRSMLWKPGTVFRVRFLGGSREFHDQARRAASEWTRYANLRFDFGEHADAQIRISFQDNSSWAYLGTQTQTVSSSASTMNLGFIRYDTRDGQISPSALHEFGHMLGLVHEMNQPNANIPWNRPKVLATFTGPPNMWSPEDVERNFLARYRQGDYPSKPFDPKSIMMLPIPKEVTDGRFEVPASELRTLSDGDKRFIAELYPGR